MLPLKSTKTKFIITVLVNLVVVIGYIIFFSTISSTNKALASLEYELSAEVDREEELKNLNNTIKENEREIMFLDSYFIPVDGVVGFINDLEEYARTIGATPDIKSVDITQDIVPGAANDFEYLRVKMSVEGSWSEVVHFARLMDLLPYHLNVREMVIESGLSNDGSSTSWEGIFDIEAIKRK